MGILAAYIIPRLSLRDAFDERSFQEELVSTARYAQQLAMMRGPTDNVQFIVDNTNQQYGIQVNAAWINHANGENFPLSFPNNITASAATITYTSLGDTGAALQTITLTGGANACIEATGYAHTC